MAIMFFGYDLLPKKGKEYKQHKHFTLFFLCVCVKRATFKNIFIQFLLKC